ncbi:MAG: PD-(D/E)XK nuclease family protein [Bacteroidota bacterium]
MPVILRHGPPALPGLGERISRGAADTFLLVVPTRRRVRHLVRELVQKSPARALGVRQVHTLETLALALFSRIFPATGVLRGPVTDLVFHAAIRRARGHFTYFSSGAGLSLRRRGTFESIKAVINRLRETGVSAAMLEEEREEAGPDERRKLADVALLYRQYEEQLAVRGSQDVAGVFRILHTGCSMRRFARSFQALFPRVSLIVVEGFDEFTDPEMGLLQKLGALPSVSLTLLFDYAPGNPALFGHLEENYARFRSFGFASPEEPPLVSSPAPPGEEGIPQGISPLGEAAARGLFRAEPGSAQRDPGVHVTVVRAAGREEEAEFTARLLKHLVLENPSRDLSRICVAMIRPGLYTALLRPAFERVGVPANITDRFALGASPLAAGILGLLAVPVRGYRRDDILRILHPGYFSFPGVERGNLARQSLRLKITGGYAAWCRRLERDCALLERRLQTAEERDGESLADELRLVRRALEDIARLRSLLAPFEERLLPGQFRSRVRDLLEAVGVRENILRAGEGKTPDLAERDMRALGKFLGILDLASDLPEAEGGEAVPRHAAEYLERLQVAVSGERYNPREEFGRGVLVTSIEETRGLDLEVMILIGLVEGEFPSVYQPEVFYSLARQARRARRHTWEQRYLFYQAVSRRLEHLYLVHPERDGPLELVRSGFVDALLEIAPAREWKNTGEAPWAHAVLSAGEALERYGRGLRRGEEDAAPALLEAAAGVLRAVRVEQSRLGGHSMPAFEGIIGQGLGARARETLDGLRNRTWSVTRLETYGACPFRFFAERLLRLRPPEELEEELSPLERGTILHEVLCRFHRARRARLAPPILGCSKEEFKSALAELTACAEELLGERDFPDVFWEADREMLLGRPGTPEGILHDYLAYERARKTSLEPRYFEVAFGRVPEEGLPPDPHLSREEPARCGGVRVRGRVDRVDVGAGCFTVVDYKTGSVLPGLKEMEEGRSLQLPLYLGIVRELLEAREGRSLSPAGGIYYRIGREVQARVALGSAEFKEEAFPLARGKLLPAGGDLANLMRKAEEYVASYVDGASRGRFPLAPPDRAAKVCRYCPHATVCRIQAATRVQPAEEEQGDLS